MSNRKRILMISRFFKPHIGGVENHVLNLSKSLKAKGYDVEILTSKSKEEERNGSLNEIRIQRIDTLNIKIIGLIYIWFQLLKNFKKFMKADIIHVHDVFIWIIPLKLLLPLKKIYLTMHGWEGVYPIPIKNILLKRLSNFLSSGSISVGTFIDKFYGTKSDYITYGGVDIHAIVKKKKNKIVYVGRLGSDTGIEKILSVLRNLKSMNMVFVGDGNLREECEKYGKVTGFLEDPQKEMKDSPVVFASGYLTILEGLINKSLVVALYSSKLRQIYLEGTPFKNYIISSSSEDIITTAIEEHINDNKSIKLKIDKGYQWAKKQTWQNVANTYLKLWEEI